MSIWFEGEQEIACQLRDVSDALASPGAHYVGVVSLMPGLSSVELVDEGPDFVTIRTNEGLMTRSNLSRIVDDQRVVVEFDEEYKAGAMVTARTHFMDEFTATERGVRHRLVLSGVEAAGILGFFYRKLGSKNIGKALLSSYRRYFEETPDAP